MFPNDIYTFFAPFDAATFLTEQFGRQTVRFERHNPNFYQDLLTPQMLDDVLLHWPNAASLVHAERDDGMRRRYENRLKQNQSSMVLNALDEGDTLVLDQQDHRLPSLSHLSAVVENYLHAHTQSNIYITPPNSKGFKPHVDNHHVFILQTSGRKLWRINTEVAEESRRNKSSDQVPIDEDNHISFMLEQGDMVYIPPYVAHEAISQDCYSVHVTFSPYPQTLGQLLQHLLKDKAVTEIMERPLPFGLFDHSPDNVINTAQQGLAELSQQLNDTIATGYITHVRENLRGLYHGALATRISPPTFQSSDQFVANQELYQRKVSNETEVTIQLPHKVASFPIEFETPLHFCLSGTVFCYEDIPEMSDEERNVLLTRLLLEGLVIRC